MRWTNIWSLIGILQMPIRRAECDTLLKVVKFVSKSFFSVGRRWYILSAGCVYRMETFGDFSHFRLRHGHGRSSLPRENRRSRTSLTSIT